MPNGPDTSSVIVLRWWHVLGSVVTFLVVIGILYGQLTVRIEMHTDQIRRLEEESVKQEQFIELREDLRQRLERIERKIDMEHEILRLDPPDPKKR